MAKIGGKATGGRRRHAEASEHDTCNAKMSSPFEGVHRSWCIDAIFGDMIVEFMEKHSHKK